MIKNWNPEERQRYEALIDEQMRKGCWVICLLALFLYPAFIGLDYYSHNNFIHQLLIVRAITVGIFIVIFAYINMRRSSYNVKLVSFIICSVASLACTAKCMVLGGFVSPYYAGIMLVMVATLAAFPSSIRGMSLLLGTEVSIYVLGCLYQSGFSLAQDEAIMNNMYMIFSTAFIGIFGSVWSEKSRILSFDRYLQLDKAKKEINASKQMLQFELASEQSNVQMLVMEITNRKAELERALNLRKEFISLASHELNTPLTSLKLITQMYQQKFKKDGTIEHAALERLLKTYDDQVHLLTRIVTDMLDVSKIENGKLPLLKDKTDLNALIQKVIEFSSLSYQKEIKYECDQAIFGMWDQLRVEQVMLNLINNAIKYGDGKLIEVNLTSENDHAVIVVKDSGIGIPEDMMNKIFGRFERAVNPNQFAGLGIGLYIANQIVKAHSGRIEVKSKLGEGSEFSVLLPLA